MNLPAFFEEDRAAVDAALERLMPAEHQQPPSIHRAMRYSVQAGGKRVRPILCVETARIFAPDMAPVLPVACALEFIHTYSLIHDDLPARDNDDLRRGKPTCHKKFGEAAAILAGDALLTLAFETISATPVAPAQCVAIVKEVASAAGTVNGMVGGQVADLEAERQRIEPEMLEYIHRAKTAALIRASVTAGALCANAPAANEKMSAKSTPKRLDALPVERGLADSIAKAQAMILAGEVSVDGTRANKAGTRFPQEARIEVTTRSGKFASRGGLKLEGALDDFALDPAARICLDIGSSTGGFTDCLLQRGAARVYAVDINVNQLA